MLLAAYKYIEIPSSKLLITALKGREAILAKLSWLLFVKDIN
jgi:hypothetical protein